MKLTITAHCTFCACSFPVLDEKTEILGSTLLADLIFCDDEDGKLCCTDCLHSACGRGHLTEDDREACEEFHVDNYGQDIDYDGDAFRNWALDTAAGVI